MNGRTPSAPDKRGIFAFLTQADPSRLCSELLKENMRTVAAVLAHCEPVLAAKVMSRLPAAARSQVVSSMKSARDLPADILREVAAGLKARLSVPAGAARTPQTARPAPGMVRYGGPEVAAAILRYADSGTRDLLRRSEPELFEKLNGLLFTFDDFANSSLRDLQAVFAQVETDTVALALRVSTPELRRRVLSALTDRRAALVREELERQARVGVSEVEAAQRRIVDLALDLRHRGKASFGGEGDLV